MLVGSGLGVHLVDDVFNLVPIVKSCLFHDYLRLSGSAGFLCVDFA